MNEIDIFESSVINDRLYYILNENKDLIERRGFKYNIKYNENKERIIELTVYILLLLLYRRLCQL